MYLPAGWSESVKFRCEIRRVAIHAWPILAWQVFEERYVHGAGRLPIRLIVLTSGQVFGQPGYFLAISRTMLPANCARSFRRRLHPYTLVVRASGLAAPSLGANPVRCISGEARRGARLHRLPAR